MKTQAVLEGCEMTALLLCDYFIIVIETSYCVAQTHTIKREINVTSLGFHVCLHTSHPSSFYSFSRDRLFHIALTLSFH